MTRPVLVIETGGWTGRPGSRSHALAALREAGFEARVEGAPDPGTWRDQVCRRGTAHLVWTVSPQDEAEHEAEPYAGPTGPGADSARPATISEGAQPHEGVATACRLLRTHRPGLDLVRLPNLAHAPQRGTPKDLDALLAPLLHEARRGGAAVVVLALDPDSPVLLCSDRRAVRDRLAGREVADFLLDLALTPAGPPRPGAHPGGRCPWCAAHGPRPGLPGMALR